MGFDEWFSDPLRGLEIDALIAKAREQAAGEGEEGFLAILACLAMEHGWNAKATSSSDGNDSSDGGDGLSH
jgi:hypothetical protein